MIPRTLIPFGARPAASAEEPAPKRLSSSLDTRTLMPADLPVAPLDSRTSIPTHLPLEVLAARMLVPRDMPVVPLEATSAIPQHVPLTVLDSRVAVPRDVKFAPIQPPPIARPRTLPGIIEPDVLTTGEVNLLAEPEQQTTLRWNLVARVSSTVFHGALIVFMLLWPTLFPYKPPTQEEMELARRQLSFVYLPPSAEDVPTIPSSPSERVSPQVRIDPRILRQVAPPDEEPQPLPGPPERERVTRDLPNAPTPRISTPAPDTSLRQRAEPPREVARLESPKPLPESPSGLIIPRTSPGKALEESIRGAAKNRDEGGVRGGYSAPMPRSPGGGGSGGGLLSQGYELLTPTEGVDFTNYLARVLASVRRNWYAVIPESARLGDKGRVVLQFRILRNGSVPFPEPGLMLSSGKEPLDRAALSAIRASNPFEPLPPAFSGPHIELRFIFLYNIRIDEL